MRQLSVLRRTTSSHTPFEDDKVGMASVEAIWMVDRRQENLLKLVLKAMRAVLAFPEVGLSSAGNERVSEYKRASLDLSATYDTLPLDLQEMVESRQQVARIGQSRGHSPCPSRTSWRPSCSSAER